MFEIGSGGWLAILAILGLINSLAIPIVGAYINARIIRHAKDATIVVEEAKQETARLIAEARSTRTEVTNVGRVAEETLGVAKITHDLLNGEHIKILHTLVLLAERIARDHPKEAKAQAEAREARDNYDKARP